MKEPTGYSGKPLILKLGHKADDTICLINAPQKFHAYLLKEHVNCVEGLPATWLHGFFSAEDKFATFLQNLDLAKVDKGFWLSWPKKSSDLQADLTEQSFRDAILPLGWVDVKAVAVDKM